ncbi:MAG: lipoyl domain-containing protein [Acidimicrobiia bacterium]|jgi:pyruvate/2-oxoglutarate dehydrogenase complex dihydrolipoamide acyltransferase (E2) component
MRVPIKLAQLGYDMETAVIGSWLVSVGASVQRGDPLLEVETDKATVEMEALASGLLVEIVHDTGAEVEVGTIIGYLETSDS